MIKDRPTSRPTSASFAPAADYANARLAELGFDISISDSQDHPAYAWRRSGLLKTTGLMLPSPLISHVDGALLALQALAPEADLPLNAGLLMGERARLRSTVRKGRFCAGGYGRLLDCRGGRIALNLVRDDDWVLIPAWLEADVSDWAGIAGHVKDYSAEMLEERASEIGLAAAIDHLPEKPDAWFSKTMFQPAAPKLTPLVVDLSGLWAGPLASSLLQNCGARVIKVEGPMRPDGMRNGHKGFYELLNAGKECAAFNFRDSSELGILKMLLEKADIVIEASRPRALNQLGVRAKEFVSRKPGKIWARLTAYGQDTNRIGFGDDIGISAGLASIMERAHGEPCFVGDAIADPVNGVHLALAIWGHYLSGGGGVIDLSMRDVLRFAIGDVSGDLREIAKDWRGLAHNDAAPFYPLRAPSGVVRSLGADTDRVVAELC